MQTHAIVEIRFGRLQGKKAIIAPGGRLKVGRTDWADLVVPHDLQMSGEHFELAWDGSRCWLKDLGSAKGTLLGGEQVREGEVEHGGWIRAGQTDFLVHVEGRTPPRDQGDDAHEADPSVRARAEETRAAQQAAAEQALESLRAEAEKEPLYAVLDAARTDRIRELVRQNVEEYRSLYEGTEGETLAHVAPYLVGPMQKSSRLLESLVREGWGRRWGIYFTSRSDFKEVRRHLRRFLMVERDDTGEKLYFRFYDPGTARIFFPVFTKRQRSEFFGIIEQVILEAADGTAASELGGATGAR